MSNIRPRWAALLLAPALACAGLPREFPERADELAVGVQLITTELDEAELEQLTDDLVTLVEAEGYALAVRYEPRAGGEQIELLFECQVPVHYTWVSTLGHDAVYDADQDLFVTAHPGRPNTWVRLGQSAHVEPRVERVARIDDYVREPFERPACAGATHVISEFSVGVVSGAGVTPPGVTDAELERLLAVWLEPLPDPQQQRWLARRDRRHVAGNVALSVLGTVALASLAVVCLADVDNCDSDDDDDGFYAGDGDDVDGSETSPRSASIVTPGLGFELGRRKRAKLEAGGAGLRLRF